MKIKLSKYIAKRLVELGVSHGFSVTGGGAMHLNNGLGHQEGLTITYNHHEQACAMAVPEEQMQLPVYSVHGLIPYLCLYSQGR